MHQITKVHSENSLADGDDGNDPKEVKSGTTVSTSSDQKTTEARRCDSNLCLFGGICDPVSQKCKCRGPFIGK